MSFADKEPQLSQSSALILQQIQQENLGKVRRQSVCHVVILRPAYPNLFNVFDIIIEREKAKTNKNAERQKRESPKVLSSPPDCLAIPQ
jgi:hypothetical protein